MLVHMLGKVDSPCCANWALRKTSPKNLPDVKQGIERNFYMDDFLKSLSNTDELIELSKRVISTLLSHGFHLPGYFIPTIDKLTFKPVTKDYHNTKHGIL